MFSPGLPERKSDIRTEHTIGAAAKKCSPSLACKTINWCVAGVVEDDRDRGLVVGDERFMEFVLFNEAFRKWTSARLAPACHLS